jgi:DNA-binding NarL/FixJ family response regulator
VVREGLALLLSRHRGLEVVGLASSVDEALALDVARVDVVLLDISMPGRSGLESVPDVRARWPAARVVIVTVHPPAVYADAAMTVGAAGYVSKSADPDEIRSAVVAVARGGTWFPGADTARVTPTGAKVDLTAREHEVLTMLASGERVTDIAAALRLSVKTVSGHKVRLARKLGAANSAQIGLIAREMGLLP